MAGKLRVGVMMESVQLSDIVGIDILGNISKAYISEAASIFPEFAQLAGQGIDITWYYISSSLQPAPLTPIDFKYLPNVTYDDCPRDLDIVLIGGPSPSHRPAAADRFMKEAWEKTRVWMTTCIGSQWLASSGVLKDRKCTTNRPFLPALRQMYPETEWIDQRWVVDHKPYSGSAGGLGELWTSGGAGAGIDMIANYALKNFDVDLVRNMALGPLEFDPNGSKGQYYD